MYFGRKICWYTEVGMSFLGDKVENGCVIYPKLELHNHLIKVDDNVIADDTVVDGDSKYESIVQRIR